jgi:hypothetical protein
MPNPSGFSARTGLTFGVMGGKGGKIMARSGKVDGKNGNTAWGVGISGPICP